MRLRRGAPEPDLRFVTVVTYGRTGSTAVQVALNALPGVLVRGENYNALRGLAVYAQALAETSDRHKGGRPTSPWFGAKVLSPGDILADLRAHVVRTVLKPGPDTRWAGFKEVRYEPGHFATYDQLLDYVLFLGRLLPGLRYVVNVRDPASAAVSGWWPDNPNALEVLTTTRDRLARATADLNAILGDGHAALVDYDDWTADATVLIDAFAALGLPRDDEAVRAALGQRLDHGPHAADRG